MNATKKRVLIWLVLASLLVLALTLLLRPRPIAVDLGVIAPDSLVVTIDETGETRVTDAFVVSAPVTGRLRRIEAEPGDTVVAGKTVLARIEPIDPALLDLRSRRQALAALDAAEDAETLAKADLARAQADAEFAEAEFRRAQQLREELMIPIRELELANHDRKTARAVNERARAALAISRAESQRARALLLVPDDSASSGEAPAGVEVRAPVDGIVLAVRRESEGIVTAGEPLLEIGDTADLEIVVDLLSTDAVRVRAGQQVVIDDWGGDGDLEGVVRRVEPFATLKVSALGIEEKRANAVIDLISAPEDRPGLGHGYQLEVRIVLWEGDGVLSVPLTSLVRNGDSWALYVEEDGRAARRSVELGRRTDLRAEILSGIESGDRIVRHPGNRIDDAVRIVGRQTS